MHSDAYKPTKYSTHTIVQKKKNPDAFTISVTGCENIVEKIPKKKIIERIPSITDHRHHTARNTADQMNICRDIFLTQKYINYILRLHLLKNMYYHFAVCRYHCCCCRCCCCFNVATFLREFPSTVCNTFHFM